MLTNSKLPKSQLAYLEQTSDSPYCLVMLHGWMDNAASFIPLINQLPTSHCIALDFPGHGLSPHRQGYYHFVDYVDDVFAALAELDLNKPIILVGHSLGALVASCFAAAFPELLLGLVCIDGIGPLSLASSETSSHMAKAIRQRQQLKPAKGFAELEYAVKLRANTNGISQENSRLLVERATIERDGLWYWRHDEKLKLSSPLRFSEQQAKQICQSIVSPCLLLAACEHPLLTAEYISLRQGWFNNIHTEMLSGGHHLHMQNPQAVALRLQAFIETIV
ncbi:alpha/beta hydrolase [Agarivorans aestuarii]|uniref:Alpha/beta hydrolase n=1 Tax=Agarivorans aestuarii TaxID=1563703 RepID=A0ABU7FZN1_9ALTE|nr:alpha/beta hydrolase [Agarivorans aestuarii]MEE1672533.1 alpha/beta hydrolase [Agarivorans aestuarii]